MVTWQKVIRCLHAWHMLDNLDICIVCFWRHADGWSRTAKTVRRFRSRWCCFLLFLKKSTFFVSFLLSFRWLSVLSHVLNEGINKINDYKCLWRPASPFSFCDRHASRNVVAETVRRGWRFLSVCIVCGRLWQNKGNENHMKTLWKLVKESTVVWWCLTWFAFNWFHSVSFVLLFDLFWATNLQASLLSLSKDFQAWFSSVQAQQIMYLSEIVSC